MTSIPISITDNFLQNPYNFKEWGLNLKYSSSPINNYPGKRTECLSKIHPFLYKNINEQILSLYFPQIPEKWTAKTHFHLISPKDFKGTGWIHQDPNQITSIIYLSSNPNSNEGTSLYELNFNRLHPYNTLNDQQIPYLMRENYKNSSLSKEKQKFKDEWDVENFTKILDISSKFNRLLSFDPSTFHSNNFTSSSERLTLISFIDNVFSSPTIRSKQINII